MAHYAKRIFFALAIFACLNSAGIAHAQFGSSFITLPSNFVASTSQATTQIFTDLSPIEMLVLALIAVAVVLEIIVGSFRK